ncbi:MAG: hypothetical protein QXH99_05595 [Sulfolobales archaeon]|jgi:U3 small nucleolar ribonucleoprotein protein IMP4|nr:hypothetical protein [Desulfurococcaceae archaeon]
MVLIITTSRNPSRRSRSFIKDLVAVVPTYVRVNRGKKTLDDLINIMYTYNSNGVVILYERKGNPSALVYYVNIGNKLQRRILIKLGSIKLCREIKGFQRPIKVRYLFVDSNEANDFQHDVIDALTTILDIKVSSNTNLDGVSEVGNAVKVVLSKCDDHVCVGFKCVGSGRPCGPEFKILKVINYGV